MFPNSSMCNVLENRLQQDEERMGQLTHHLGEEEATRRTKQAEKPLQKEVHRLEGNVSRLIFHIHSRSTS